MIAKKIAIIGGGPNSVYAIEIFLKTVLKKNKKKKFKLLLFDSKGDFGYGNTHSINLDKNILLNRIAHQISLGSYPFFKFPKKFEKYEYNFMEWVKNKKIKSINKESWPARSVFGYSLKDKFFDILKILEKNTNVDIQLIYEKVLGVRKLKKKNIIITKNKNIICDNLLIATGNYNSSKKITSLSRKIEKLTADSNCKFYHNFLELLPNKNFWDRFNNSNVVVYGTGVSSIDIISMLQRKKAKIYSISRSSLFPFARPFNQKISDPEKYEHKPIFLKDELIQILKKMINKYQYKKELNFEKFINPLIKLEFCTLYFSHFLDDKIFKEKVKFLKKKIFQDLKSKTVFDLSYLYDDLNYFVVELIKKNNLKNKFYNGNWFSKKEILKPILEKKYTFYDLFTNPLITSNSINFKKDYLKFLKWDINEAQKGNVDSAYKNACDGVWRDIRQQFTKLFDNCDNLKILNYFLTNIMSIHNKLCDGPSVDSIIFIRKLIKEKKIELLRKSEFNFLKKGKEIYLNQKNKKIKINTIFYGLADLYKKDYKNDLLINSMYKNNIVTYNEQNINNRKIRIGLRINKDQSPINRYNKIDKSIRLIGPTSEGRKFFHHTLSRPDKLQFCLTDLFSWANSVV